MFFAACRHRQKHVSKYSNTFCLQRKEIRILSSTKQMHHALAHSLLFCATKEINSVPCFLSNKTIIFTFNSQPKWVPWLSSIFLQYSTFCCCWLHLHGEPRHSLHRQCSVSLAAVVPNLLRRSPHLDWHRPCHQPLPTRMRHQQTQRSNTTTEMRSRARATVLFFRNNDDQIGLRSRCNTIQR